MKRFTVLCILLVLVLAGCGDASSVVAPTATSVPTPRTADQLVQSLKAQGLPIGEVFTYAADNDPNHLLGRPGQYIGKTNWIDTRLTTTDTGVNISVRDGGSIEAFANLADANNRFAYIQQISKSSSLFAEYEYQQGMAVLRVSSTLTPDQAQVYADAFRKATN